jgi:hypothetical protein
MHPSLDPNNRKATKAKAVKEPHIYTPWNIAGESEHSQQAAFFCWANFAARFGFAMARDGAAYEWVAREALAGRPIAPALDPLSGPFYAVAVAPVPVLARLHAIPNGGLRMPATSAMLKAEGAKSGVPDVFFPHPKKMFSGRIEWYHGAYIEFKQEKYRNRDKGGLSDEQVDWAAALRNEGYAFGVAYNWIEAANFITEYLTT